MPPDEDSWERALFEVLDDLEADAASVFAAARAPEVEDRAHSEYLSVTLASRLMAELDYELTLHVEGVGLLTGVLLDVGAGWIALGVHGTEWLIRSVAITELRPVRARSVPEAAWPARARRRISSPVRRLAEDHQHCLFHRRSGGPLAGRPLRIGQDFIEIRSDTSARPVLVTLPTLSAIQVQPAPPP